MPCFFTTLLYCTKWNKTLFSLSCPENILHHHRVVEHHQVWTSISSFSGGCLAAQLLAYWQDGQQVLLIQRPNLYGYPLLPNPILFPFSASTESKKSGDISSKTRKKLRFYPLPSIPLLQHAPISSEPIVFPDGCSSIGIIPLHILKEKHTEVPSEEIRTHAIIRVTGIDCGGLQSASAYEVGSSVKEMILKSSCMHGLIK